MMKPMIIKRLIIAFALTGFLIPAMALAASQGNPTLKKVTVYTDRALIEREITVAVKRGENTVSIPQLSPWLDSESLQVGWGSQTGIRLGEISVEVSLVNIESRPDVEKLQQQLDEVNGSLAEAMARKEAILRSNDYLQRGTPSPSEATSVRVRQTLEVEEAVMANYGRIAKIDGEVKLLQERKSILEVELAELQPRAFGSKTVNIRLWSATDVPALKLNLLYVAKQSGWQPVYEARATSERAAVNLTMFASVWQSTGEDWSNANVEVSTAQPFVYSNPPKLSGWYLDVWQPRPVMAKSDRIVLRGNSSLSAAPAPMNELDEVVVTQIREEGTAFNFIFPEKVAIVSDGKPHRFAIATADADAKMGWFTAPKLVNNVLLKASFKNPFTFPALSGQVTVFFDQRMVGSSYTGSTILPDGEWDLSFGVDESIKVERKLEKKFTDYAGVLSKESKIGYQYSITITNSRNRAVEVELNDQFPLSRNEKIRVEMEKPAGGDASVNDEGVISWKLKLDAGEKRVVPLQFTVTYPKDVNINGLP